MGMSESWKLDVLPSVHVPLGCVRIGKLSSATLFDVTRAIPGAAIAHDVSARHIAATKIVKKLTIGSKIGIPT